MTDTSSGYAVGFADAVLAHADRMSAKDLNHAASILRSHNSCRCEDCEALKP